MKTLTYGSVCSGIEAASVAWEPLGFRPAWFAEIEPFPCAVLAHHYPHVANLGDMTQIAMLVRAGLVEAPDILVGGTPCQAFSLAGVRGGLSDPRGQLTLAYADLADAIDEKRRERGEGECVIYWENVPGVLSSADNAFGCFLGLLAGEDVELTPEPTPAPGKNSKFWKWDKKEQKHACRWPNVGCVYGPQRTIAWRVLDAQYFGVAQRRRRVFVVASARKDFNPAALLFESDGVRRDIAPSRETGPSTSRDVAPCLTSSRLQRIGDPTGQDPIVAVSNAEGSTELPFLTTSNIGKHVNNQTPLVASVALRGRDGGATAELGDDVAGCLRASGGGGDKPHVLAPIAHVETMPTLRAGTPSGGPGHGARSGDSKDEYIVPVCVTGSITHTLKAEGFDASEDGTGRGQPIVAAVANTLTANWHVGGGATAGSNPGLINPVVYRMAVRRLTPRECERLQGFPDDYTLVPVKGKPAADGPRYKALGNSMARPCMEWLGVRLIVTHPHLFMERLAA